LREPQRREPELREPARGRFGHRFGQFGATPAQCQSIEGDQIILPVIVEK
jgi:hypothetical protein